MIALETLLQTVAVDKAELTAWIESGWVRPETETGSWAFREVDVARVRLIAEIRHDLAIDDEAVPVVLSLLDQLYGLRRDLTALCSAIAVQPSDVRAAIATALHEER
jgi:chaperone modulatory protein CbpM